jgi:pimeloyl-ACP methyl ester carboxylesterase
MQNPGAVDYEMQARDRMRGRRSGWGNRVLVRHIEGKDGQAACGGGCKRRQAGGIGRGTARGKDMADAGFGEALPHEFEADAAACALDQDVAASWERFEHDRESFGGVMVHSRALEDWINAGHRERLAGHGIFCRVQAAPGKEPLLLIHGYPTASYDWHPLWAPLAERYSLYALDMLGFGLSDKPRDSDYPIMLQADLCTALLAQYGVTRPHVLAHDYGDTVAQELLARESEGRLPLASVCFLNGGLFPETHRARPIQKLLALRWLGPILARAMTYDGFAKTMRSIGGREPPPEQDLQDLWALLVRDDGRRALARLINYMEQRRQQRPRWVGALVQSKVPRRLLCGALDPVSGRHLAERYRELVPDADVVLFDDLGHYPHLEAPQAILAAYLGFRDRLALRTARTP